MRLRQRWIRPGVAVAVLFLAACADRAAPVAPADEASQAQERVVHSRPQVAAWFERLSPEVMSLPHTVYAAHDENTNQLVVAVEQRGAIRGVENALRARGVPASAYRIQVSQPIRFMSTTLRTAHRPTVGGIQIHWSNFVCTLGFNVDHANGRSFITNSHCTNQQGTTGNTAYYQPVSNVEPTAIAFEAHDPPYTRGGGCSPGRVCRFSDAARALYQSGTTSSRGAIAKTTGENNGSLTTSGGFSITAQNNTSTSFSGTIHKVGRTTGWTSGNVTSTCATVNVSGSNIQLRCQTLVQRSESVIVGGGDSGSPVFTRSSGDNVTLVGILWGGSSSGDLFVFSPLKNIQDELGGLTATSDGSGGGDGGGDGGGGGGNECIPRGPNGNNCK